MSQQKADQSEYIMLLDWDRYWDCLYCKECSRLHSRLVRLIEMNAYDRQIRRIQRHVMLEHFPIPRRLPNGEIICDKDKHLLKSHDGMGFYTNKAGERLRCGVVNEKSQQAQEWPI
jgi:hypothetical protein